MSKTVKRVSKTVKTVMTITMIGLVAMLGAKAEAHTRWFNGKPRVCSICSPETTLIEVPADPDPINAKFPAPAVAELIVETKLVRIKCPDNTEVLVKDNVTLSTQTPSSAWSYDPVTMTAQVDFVVSDQYFEELGFCGVDIPANVLIQKMEATYIAHECTGPSDDPSDDPCSTKVLTSTMELKNCRVSPDAADGTEYVCNSPRIKHEL